LDDVLECASCHVTRHAVYRPDDIGAAELFQDKMFCDESCEAEYQSDDDEDEDGDWRGSEGHFDEEVDVDNDDLESDDELETPRPKGRKQRTFLDAAAEHDTDMIL
jgi:hypothetical protein